MRFPLLTTVGTVLVFAVLVAGSLKPYVIRGHSMEPSLEPGQVVLVGRLTYQFRNPRTGELVVFRSPLTSRLSVKRLHHVEGDSLLFVLGDNEGDSIDSRHFGAIPREAVIGRVLFAGRHNHG